MIRTLAVDDEPLALKKLSSYIEKIPFFELAGSCQSAAEAGNVIKEEQIDAIFLDINMPDLNGMDFIRSLEEPPIVVFTTAYSEYAIEGYKVNAVDYLLKPYSFEQFKESAQKVKKLYEQKMSMLPKKDDYDDKGLYVKADYKIIRINLDEITFIESMNEYAKFHFDNPEKTIVTLLSLKKLVTYLDRKKFMRIHRSYIVNIEKVQRVGNNLVYFKKEGPIPVGDNYRNTFIGYLESRYIGNLENL